MIVYIAGSSKELDRARKYMRAVRESDGLELALDWTVEIEANRSANVGLGFGTRRAAAGADLEAIKFADVVWLLVPKTRTSGAWVEMGFTLANRIALICSGKTTQSIFCSLADHEFQTDHRALTHLRQLGREQ